MARAKSDHDWPAELFALLREHHVTFFPFVPDAGNSRLIEMAEAAMNQALEESRPGVYRWVE